MIKELTLVGMLMGVTEAEVSCLAMNMYHEARNQSFAGQLAVSNVTMNRVNDERFPDTICEVVKQGPTRPSWKDKTKRVPIRNRCQFSWFCDGKSDEPYEVMDYENIYNIAVDILNQNMPYLDITDGATHYHADYVQPSWAFSKVRTVEIEDHIFYRWEYGTTTD